MAEAPSAEITTSFFNIFSSSSSGTTADATLVWGMQKSQKKPYIEAKETY